MANWSLLPPFVLGSVAGLLGLADQARMASVCKPWRSAMADGFCRLRPVPSIWLLAPRLSGCEFLSFSEGMSRRYCFPMPGGRTRPIGSSQGWVMVEDELAGLQAFNPVTRSRLLFPRWIRDPGKISEYKKAVIVPPKPGSSGCQPLVVAVLRHGVDGQRLASSLAFAAAGDGVWTVIAPLTRGNFADIAAGDGKLYALEVVGRVQVFAIGDEGPSAPAPAMVIPTGVKHLGFVSGELILLRGWASQSWPFQRRRPMSKFEALRLQRNRQNRGEWAKVKDLAGHAILLGFDGFVALPVGEFRELDADCVYCVEGKKGNGEARLTQVNLGNKQVGCVPLPLHSSSIFWFLPNPET